MTSQVENSAKRISMDIYKKMLVWPLHQLDQDHELERLVAGIPESEAFSRVFRDDDRDVQHKLPHIQPVLAVLSGSTSSCVYPPLAYHTARTASAAKSRATFRNHPMEKNSDLLEGTLLHPWRDLRRTRIIRCEEALLPGVSTAVELPRYHLWGTSNEDIALSVRT
ncbi:hypothetical protein EI94DRAFT_796042 [Lactarius quietus]|nr:hypothetical protein EI94DRAFT_1291328 [Lactarius quietus]KAF8261498.1 hypothetical protein EI94DRAFT_796042 [Lactarius quietus]